MLQDSLHRHQLLFKKMVAFFNDFTRKCALIKAEKIKSLAKTICLSKDPFFIKYLL